MKKMLKKIIAWGLTLVLIAGVAAGYGTGKVYASEGGSRSFTPTDKLDGDYGYNDLALRSNGAARQEFYQMLEVAAERFGSHMGDLNTAVVAEIDVAQLGLSNEELGETYYMMREDNPQYYWMSNEFSVRGTTVLFKTYNEYCDYAVRKEVAAQLDAALQEYDATVAGLTSSYAVAQAIHDKLIRDVEYAYQPDGVTPCNESYAHNIVGVIDDSLASVVCEGYAKMYQLLLNRYGIKNLLVSGIGNGDAHAWNLVQMDDGNYYCTDVTWDDTNIAMENGVDTISYQYFNAAGQDFNVLHTPQQVGEGPVYYAALPEISDNYDYTYYAKNGGLIAEKMILNYANGTDTELESLIAEVIRTYRALGSSVYLYSYGDSIACMTQYGDVVGTAIGNAAYTLDEFANGFSYSWYTLEDECIIDFNVPSGGDSGGSGDPGGEGDTEVETGPLAISLYKDGVLIGEYAGLGSVFEQMTDENGNYVVQFDSEVSNHFYVPSSWSQLPKAKSIVFSGWKQGLGEVFYVTAVEIRSDFTISGNLTFDYIQFVSTGADVYLSNAVLYLGDYSSLSTDIYAENAQIYAQHNNSLGSLYGECDVTLNGEYLALYGSAEIDTLIVGGTGRLELMGGANQDYKVYKINKVISEYYSPIMCFGNNHDIRIGEIDLTKSGNTKWSFFQSLSESELLPRIKVDKLTGIEEVWIQYGLSAFLSYTDSETGEEVGTQLVVLDKSILKNCEGYFLTCPVLELDQVLVTYSAEEDKGVIVVNKKNDNFYLDVDAVSEITYCEVIGHSPIYDESVVPTCTESGLTEGIHCSVCNKVILEQKIDPALGHFEVEMLGTKATCTTSGLTEGSYCSVCEEILVAQEVIKAFGHKEEKDKAIEASCTTPGLTEGKHCSVCKEVLVSQEVVKALGHTEVTDKAMTATCTTAGLTEGKHCSVCKEVLVSQEEVKALGHTWEVENTANGVITYVCTTCGEKKEEKEPNVQKPQFEDVKADAFYAEPVLWAVENNITNGYGSATTFCPDITCTRGQVVTFLWRAKGSPEPTSTVNPFTDIKESDYFYKAVLWAVENGITAGYGSDTIFNPNGACTRGQVATFLWRAEGKPGMSSAENPFTDVASDKYYYDAVLWAVANDVTNGYGGSTTFAPDLICNRGQIVTFLYRAVE